jgi:peptidoglycan/xylan/chitin deacetylase (PgdA/CDA1 family)
MRKTLIAAVIIGILAFAGWFVFTEYLYVVPILTYHHIDEETHKDSPTVLVKNFQKQMEFIHDKGYNVITLDELVTATIEKRKLARNSVVITVDDGYRDNYAKAYPVFKKYNFPATIFIISRKIGQKDYLSWDEIRQMQQNNISFGAHSRTHPYLPAISSKQQKEEIAGSKEDIEQKLNTEVKYFCYPVGGFNREVISLVKQSGFKGACTTNKGKGWLNKNIYALKRIKMKDSDIKAFNLWRKLCGFYYWFIKEKAPH